MMARHTLGLVALCILAASSLTFAAKDPKPAKADRPPDILGGGQYGGFSRKAAEGPHMTPIFATHFGSASQESFNATGELADGTILAVGNAWGPDFPTTPAPTILGTGKHSGAAPALGKKGLPDEAAPDTAGMIVFYTPPSSPPSSPAASAYALARVVRFDWGVASITTAKVAADGKSFFIAGRCGANFASFASSVKAAQTITPEAAPAPAPDPKAKKGKAPKTPASPPSPPSDVYIARFSATGVCEWLVTLAKNGDTPDALWADNAGNLYFDAHGLTRISPDGRQVKVINPKASTGTAKWLGIDPRDGSSFYGGDRNTHTGYQPYRQPYLYKFSPAGEKVLTLYEPNPRECACGPGGNGLCSDSSVRNFAIARDGDFLFSGWSDGGNSVFGRQPTDWHKGVPGSGMGMSAAGVNASSLSHLVRIDPKTNEAKAHTLWLAYVPTFFGTDADARAKKARGKPNGTGIEHLAVLPNGCVAITGGAATGMIQTPNAFWKDPMLPDRHGGANVTVFKPDLSNLLFSSYTPGVEHLNLAPTKSGLAVVGTSTGSDHWVQPTNAPSINATQDYAGAADGWLLILRNP